MSDADRDRKPAEASQKHTADQPPPFAGLWRARKVRQSSRRTRRIQARRSQPRYSTEATTPKSLRRL